MNVNDLKIPVYGIMYLCLLYYDVYNILHIDANSVLLSNTVEPHYSEVIGTLKTYLVISGLSYHGKCLY